MSRVDNKVAIVTGGGRGIGEAACKLLAQAGAKLVVTDIDDDAANSVAKSIIDEGGEAIAIKHDVSSESAWQNVMDQTIESFGRLDVLVNNAGIVVPVGCKAKSIEEFLCRDISLDDWKAIQAVNYDGTFIGTRNAIRLMEHNEQRGSIINISSIAVKGNSGSTVPYSASKGGVSVFSRAAAVECRNMGFKVRINTILPGAIDSVINIPMDEERKQELHKKWVYGYPIEIAKGVLFFASDDSQFITAAELVIDGGLSASFFNDSGK